MSPPKPPYPFQREIWSPYGGYWPQPRNWKTNTAIAMLGSFAITFIIARYAVEREKRFRQPSRWIPSMLWAKEFRDGTWEYIPFNAPADYIPIADRPKVRRPVTETSEHNESQHH